MNSADIDNPLPLLRDKPESPVSAILRRVSESLSVHHIREAMELCRQAETMSNGRIDICGSALALSYRAYIHGLLTKNWREGITIAKQAITCFHLSGERHNEAMTHLIHAQIRYRAGTMNEAHSAYETSRDHLEKLHREALAAGNESQAGEYSALVRQIGERLQEIAQTIAEQHLAHVRTSTSTNSPHANSAADQVAHHSLYFLPVIGSIPAGQARISSDDVQDVVTAVDEVTIDRTRYRFRRLCGGGDLIRLDQQEYNYYLSQVAGDSMNLAGINEGDYVILRQPRNLPVSPRPDDIIAASITDMDREVTLKRYIREGRVIILKPESSNAEHQPHEFFESDPSVDIVGVAVAVLKPIE